MKARLLPLLASALAAGALAACTASQPPRPPAQPAPASPPPLRVAVDSGTPPYAFVRDGRLVGLEVDFAEALGRSLGRPVRVIDVAAFDAVIPALLDGRADIAMSGLTITRAREVRVAFSQPYLRSGLLTLMQRQDLERYPTVASVLSCDARITVVNGTTGEKFIRERCPQGGTIYPTSSTDIAVSEVRLGRVDMLIHDAPVVVWAVSAHEAGLGMLRKPLDREDLAWAMRRDDPALVTAVDAALASWRADGTRDRILDRWIPFWRELEAQAAKAG